MAYWGCRGVVQGSLRRSLVAALIVLGGCGGGGAGSVDSGDTGGGAGTAAGASGGSSSTGGTGGAATGGPNGGAAGTSAAGSAGTAGPGVGGISGSGGIGGSGGSNSAGSGGSSSAGSGGMAAGGRGGAGGSSSAGTTGSGGAGRGGSGGASGPGTGGTAGAGSGGSGGGTACTRDLLRSTITAYFTALAAHDVATLPLAAGVKFTENGSVMTVGAGGLWRTAGAVKYSQSALDTELCSSATHAVVPDGTMDIPVALRLKLVNQQITEIETIAVRPGDYRLGGQTFASNTGAIIAANTSVMWETPVAAGQRNSRAELIAWIDKYFRMFPRGVCNTVSSCRRLENGYGTFNCTDGASCAAGQPSGAPAMTPRVLLADPETGIGVGLTMFMGNTDMHMFKMYGGQVYAVHAVLGGAASSGW
jgi:hypothetical protein